MIYAIVGILYLIIASFVFFVICLASSISFGMQSKALTFKDYLQIFIMSIFWPFTVFYMGVSSL